MTGRLLARDEADLLAQLQLCHDNPPPPRGKRDKQQSEAWSLTCALLARPSLLLGWYPVLIKASDKPDVIVRTKGRKFGIEIVEAIPRSLAHAFAVTNDIEEGIGLLDPGAYRGNAVAKQEDIATQYKSGRLDSPFWTGAEAHIEWCDLICAAIETKLSKLEHGHYDKCSVVHLLIDGHDGANFSDRELPRALDILDLRLAAICTAGIGFEQIHIRKGETLTSYQSGRRVA